MRRRWRWAACLGAVLGSVTALSLDDELLRKLFAILILAVAVRLLMTRRSAVERGDPAAT